MATRRRWSETTLETELTPIVAELGCMPSRRELAGRGLAGAWRAMERHGGVAAWKERLVPRPAAADVAVRAYFLAQERGGDPLANWYAAERELLAA